MKLKLLKNVEVVVVATLLSLPVAAEFTDGPVNCTDLATNEEMYGCLMAQEAVQNKKYSCLDALKEFEVPKKDQRNDFSKPGCIKKGKKLVIVGKPDGKIGIADGKKNYKLDKDKIKRIIQAKLGSQAHTKPDFKVIVQSPKGKIKLKFKKKEGGEGGSFDLGKWEKIPMNEGESVGDDEAFVALGSQDEDQDFANQMSQALDQKVENFDSEVDEKISEIRQEAQDKISETMNNLQLTSTDQRAIIDSLNEEKQEKIDFWTNKKRRKEHLKRAARVKCQTEQQLISSSVLEEAGGGSASREAASGIASTDR